MEAKMSAINWLPGAYHRRCFSSGLASGGKNGGRTLTVNQCWQVGDPTSRHEINETNDPMTNLLCVDAAAQEDLMLNDQLARGIAAMIGRGQRLAVLLGSGEAEERRLETSGHSAARTEGALITVTPTVESTMRESVRTLSNRLTDEGVFAVGMMAGDRNMIIQTDRGVRISARCEQQIWTGPGVVPVLGCLIPGGPEGLLDKHPLPMAISLANHLGQDTRIVLVLKHSTGSRAVAPALEGATLKEKLMSDGVFLSGLPMPPEGLPWYVSGVNEIGTGQMVQMH
jgi:hypothetical protein